MSRSAEGCRSPELKTCHGVCVNCAGLLPFPCLPCCDKDKLDAESWCVIPHMAAHIRGYDFGGHPDTIECKHQTRLQATPGQPHFSVGLPYFSADAAGGASLRNHPGPRRHWSSCHLAKHSPLRSSSSPSCGYSGQNTRFTSGHALSADEFY